MGLLTVMKGLPLAYNRDMQEDKIPVFDAVDTLKACLAVAADMVSQIKFKKQRMSDTASEAFSTATDIAEYLVRKGLPFREAHEVTGRIVRHCIDSNKGLTDLHIKDLKGFSRIIGKDIYKYLTAEGSVMAKRSGGGTSRSEVEKQIRRLKKIIAGKK